MDTTVRLDVNHLTPTTNGFGKAKLNSHVYRRLIPQPTTILVSLSPSVFELELHTHLPAYKRAV